MKRNSHSFRIHLTSAMIVCAIALLFISSHLLASRATSAQDPNATLPSPKKTPTPKTTTPPPKKRTPRNSRISPAKSASDSATAGEMIFWNSIKDSANPDDFKEYLKKYPDGEFASLAKNRLKTLEGTSGSTSPSSSNPSRANSSLPHTRTNQTGIEFTWIPPGIFTMGSTDTEEQAAYENAKGYFGDQATLRWFKTEQPRHQVTIREGFYMGRYDVTQSQWLAVMGTTVQQQRDKSNTSNPMTGEGDNYPMYYVSWNEAQEFIQKLNQVNDGYTYRLPTEAEWEYACRAGTTTAFAFGDSLGSDQANFNGNYPYGGAGKGAFQDKATPVGSFQPNAFGLYDMHGNVWEWCQDWYHDSYIGAPTDGSAWLSGGEQKRRVMRGGSWSSVGYFLRSAWRSNGTPDAGNYEFGFRVVAVPRKSSSPTDSSSSNTAKPPNPPLPLHSFDFATVTLDSSGKLKNRETKSANAYIEDLGGSVRLEMVAIPPGEFMMGSPETEAHRSKDEGPQHRVRINYSFYMGEFEVTQAQWRAIMRTNPSNFKDCDVCPVEQVSWNDATEFCQKLSARTGREYRLPSEAEWEYAARAGTTTPFAFGDTITPEIVNYNGNWPYASAEKGTNRQKTVSVGSLGVANAFGLFDMHGNVYEWCQDWYHDSYAAIAGDAPTDGSAWLSGGEQKRRVLRGGSWNVFASDLRSALRYWFAPDYRGLDYGFRVVAVR